MIVVIILRLINDFFRGVVCFGYWYIKIVLFCMFIGKLIIVFKMKIVVEVVLFIIIIYLVCFSGWCLVVDLEKIFRDCNSF